MNVVILYNRLSENPLPDELDVLDQVQAVSGSLCELGHHVSELPFDLNLDRVKQSLFENAPDAVFNLVESVDQKGSLIHLAPALLKAMYLPYTGCPADAVFLTSNKILSKKWLRSANLPTPDWFLPGSGETGEVPAKRSGKWIIKSLWEHASLGMDDTAVIDANTADDISDALDLRRKRFGGDWFAERYIDGREFNIGLLAGSNGFDILKPAEIRFMEYGETRPRIVDYRAKWETESFEYRHTKRSFAFPDEDQKLLETLGDLSLACGDAFDLKGYARVDFRVDPEGRPWILEINANPCLSDDAGFAAAVSETGLTYTEAIRRILGDINT